MMTNWGVLMNYPELASIQPVLDAIKDRREFSICYHEGTSLASICYNITDGNTFDDPLCREARGIMFNTDTLEVVLRPFHKFFNVGEKPETQPDVIKKLLDNPQTKSIWPYHKTDGTMVAATIYNNELLVATKRKILKDPFYAKVDEVVRDIVSRYGDVTVVFERAFHSLTKDHQHLLEYSENHLVLLAIRDNLTGEYIDTFSWEDDTTFGLQVECGDIRLMDFDIFSSWDEMMTVRETRQLFEGWVIQVDGEFFKLKTDWYIKRHHLVGNLSERSIAKLVLGETIDDALAYLSIRFANSPVLDQAKFAAEKVATDFKLWLSVIDEMVERFDGVHMRDIVGQLDSADIGLLNQRRKTNIQYDWAGRFFKEFKHRYKCDLFVEWREE